MSVQLLRFHRGQAVVVDNKRVPMLEVFPEDGGKVLLVFDGRIGLDLDAASYEGVIGWAAKVMENLVDPTCGRRFTAVAEIAGVVPEPDVEP